MRSEFLTHIERRKRQRAQEWRDRLEAMFASSWKGVFKGVPQSLEPIIEKLVVTDGGCDFVRIPVEEWAKSKKITEGGCCD